MKNIHKHRLFGITLITIGIFMLFSMVGASFARTRAYHSRITAKEYAALQETAPSGETETDRVTPQYGRGSYHNHTGHGIRWSGRTPLPLLFLGGFFRLLVLGILGYFIIRLLKKRRQKGRDPVAKVVHEDDVGNDIRVGDEINNSSTPGDPDDMTVDDLIQAMKRLGIKKLEL